MRTVKYVYAPLRCDRAATYTFSAELRRSPWASFLLDNYRIKERLRQGSSLHPNLDISWAELAIVINLDSKHICRMLPFLHLA